MKHPMIPQVAAQLKALMYELTVDIPKQLEFARSLGDLSENAEFKMTKERQLFVESRIKNFEELMLKLQSVNLENIPTDRIAYGSRVVVEDLNSGETKSFILAFPGEEPPYKTEQDTLVTIGSPVAMALFGKRPGDMTTVRLPKGILEWEIVELKTLSEFLES